MPSDQKSLSALFDIRDCISRAYRFTEGFTFDQFCEDEKTYYATLRMLEVISEASKRLSPEIKTRHLDIPWREIRDAGNVYRHAYESVSEQAIWKTLNADLPSLLTVILIEIERIEAQPQ